MESTVYVRHKSLHLVVTNLHIEHLGAELISRGRNERGKASFEDRTGSSDVGSDPCCAVRIACTDGHNKRDGDGPEWRRRSARESDCGERGDKCGERC